MPHKISYNLDFRILDFSTQWKIPHKQGWLNYEAIVINLTIKDNLTQMGC